MNPRRVGGPFRVLRDETLEVTSVASTSSRALASVVVDFDDGKHTTYDFDHTPNTDRTSKAEKMAGPFKKNGFVTRGSVVPFVSGLRRGQAFYQIDTLRAGRVVNQLCKGYIYERNPVNLGVYEPPGPGGGEGHLQWRAVASDIAPVDITEVLAATNAFRRIYGFAWYYHSSGDTATRTLRVNVRAPGTGLPTNFSIAELVAVPNAAVVSLTANEEGIIYAYNRGRGDGFASRNDAGVLTQEDARIVPQVFPIDVVEDDLIELFFDVVDGHANDRHSVFILQEEWLVI